MSRLLRFPYRPLEELRADELAILEALAETRGRIADLLEEERGSDRHPPKFPPGCPREARSWKVGPTPSPLRRRP